MKKEKEIREIRKQALEIYNYSIKHYTKPESEQELLKNEMFAFIAGLEFALGMKPNCWSKHFMQALKEAKRLNIFHTK